MERRFNFGGGVSRATALAAVCAVIGAFAFVGAARGDEIKLKDGSTLVGTIVGFEQNSFKVKTSYGYAVVMRDQVASITISDPPKAADAAAANTSAPAYPPAKTVKNETPKPATAAAAPPAASSAATKPAAVPTSAAPTATTVASANAASAPTPAAAAPAAPPPAKPKPAEPEPNRESVVGNTYKNDTYGFQMYKPPAWNLIEGAQTILPGSITAMGTNDQTTYLLIGQDPAGKSLASDIDTTEKRLREILENFRPIDDKHVTVAGQPAIERHFRGSVDQKDWSGVVVYLSKDARVYTIFGMTLADTDLVQIQENVIARAISSLQFTK
jgi:hypothetical protein